jgi:hypothetical protein
MGQRLLGAEGVYLFLPIAMCSATLLTIHHLPSAPAADVRSVRLWFVLFAAMLAPIAVLLAPYVINGRLHDFWIGAFVLPRKRLTFAALRMPSAASIVTGIPVIALLIPVPQSMFGARVRAVDAAMWVAAVVLPVMALWNGGVYQFIWQSTRAFAVLIPIAICHRLMKRQVPSATQASVLYGLAAVLAWMSMNQFPYAGPIYFLYVTPLAVIAGVALAASTNSLGRHPILPWTLMVLLFAVLSTHRAYVQQLGVLHLPRHFDTPLNLPRAHLRLEREDADMYQRTVALVQQHLQGGQLVAGPDTPELYYLTGTQNRSGRLFDFFSGSDSDPTAGGRDWEYGQVIVINHEPAFSPKMPPEMLAQLRREFPAGEQIDIFEVRWR